MWSRIKENISDSVDHLGRQSGLSYLSCRNNSRHDLLIVNDSSDALIYIIISNLTHFVKKLVFYKVYVEKRNYLVPTVILSAELVFKAWPSYFKISTFTVALCGNILRKSHSLRPGKWSYYSHYFLPLLSV